MQKILKLPSYAWY